MTWESLDTSTKIIIKVFAVLLGLILIWYIREYVFIALLAIVLASALEPFVSYLQKRLKIPRAVSVLSVYLLAIGSVVVLIALIIPIVLSELQVFAGNFPSYTQQLSQQYPEFASIFSKINASEVITNLSALGSGDTSLLTRTVSLFNGVFAILTVLVISFYLVAEQEHGLAQIVRTFIPRRQHAFTLNLIQKIQIRMGYWVIGQLVLSGCIFLITFVILSILGIKYALFLALLAGILEILPYIGPFISAVPAIFVATVQRPILGVVVAVLYLLIQKTEGYILVPKVMEKTVGMSPIVVLFSLLIGFKLAGFIGLLLSVPLVSAVTLVMNELWENKKQTEAQENIDYGIESIDAVKPAAAKFDLPK